MEPKLKWSITVRDDFAARIDALVESRRFANRSHLIEVALMRFFEEDGGK